MDESTRGAAGNGMMTGPARMLLLIAALLLLSGTAAWPARASERVSASLVADTATVTPGASFWVALRLDIAEGWHTYWRNPGDSGEPTQLDWELPEGVRAGDIHWPAPEAIPYGPLVNFGYHGTAWHLVAITVPEDWPEDRPLELRAVASWLVCKDICVPEGADLTLRLAAANVSMRQPASATALAAARERLPAAFDGRATFSAQATGASQPTGAGEARSKQLVLTLAGLDPPEDVTSAYFFPDAWGAVDPVAPQRLTRSDGAVHLALVAGSEPPGETLAGVLVLEPERASDDPGRRAVVLEATRDQAAAPAGTLGASASSVGAGAAPGLFVALGLALLGGLILNVMPCVFPVLSIKAMGVLRHAGDRRTLRLSGISYTAGVLVFVGLVAAALIALKAAGQEVGWGFQLQSPAFVAVMALLVFTLGLSLSGVFSIGGSVMGWGSALAGGGGDGSGGARGSFFAGALAALVATPCTAPFMGVALGFALTQPWPVALAVFLALGLGLALPYLALTFLPGTARLLPRPGPWMERVKQFLAFPLYVTAAWLVWVLSLQAGAGAVFAVLVAMVLAAMAAWLLDLAQGLAGARRRVAGAACLAAGVAAVALAVWPRAGASPLPAAQAEIGANRPAVDAKLAAEPFSFARLDALRAEGAPVFVNLTAAWCITCQVNERLALSSARVAEAFRERGIVYLKGDWTNRDPEISRLLDGFGRSGVPLYLFYPPGSDRPEILPQFLTESIVIDAIGSLPAVAGDTDRTKGSG